jgi:signal transduction histidine kinase
MISSGRLQVAAEQGIRPLDTTGAGDSFNAGLVAAVGIYTTLSIARRLSEVDRLVSGIAAGDWKRGETIRTGVRELDDLADRLADMASRLSLGRDQWARDEQVAFLGRWISSQAHELKTPLAGLRMNLQLLRDDVTGESRDVVDEAIAEVDRLGDRLRAMLAPAPGKLGEARDIDPVAPLKQILPLLEREAAHRGVVLQVDLAAVQGTVHADPDSIVPVYRNLIQNAFDALGGRDDARLKIHGEALAGSSPRYRLTISDNGPGVPPDLVSRLFQPFATGRSEGTGLGLAFVRDTVRGLGGSVEYRHAEGGGASFTIELPLSPPGQSV